MARIAGVDFPATSGSSWRSRTFTESEVPGRRTSTTGVNPDTRVRDLTEERSEPTARYIDKNYDVEGDLRRQVQMNIKRLMDIGCYRGIAPRRRSARARAADATNARTRKGPRRTVAGKKK